MTKTFADELISGTATSDARVVDVLVSYEVIKLFSEQLYTTPVKAVEELVVNGWDADARHCSVLVDPLGTDPSIVVFDDGAGMSLDQLENLWHIGVSEKSEIKSPRKQIGKFGIGKLASYAVARRATYVSKTGDGVFAVTIDFEDFAKATDADGNSKPVALTIKKYDKPKELLAQLRESGADRVLTVADAKVKQTFDLEKKKSWTLVVLEDLKEKALQLKGGRLRWVLETAMPLAADFELYLDGNHISSAKEKIDKIVTFPLSDLDDSRLDDLSKATGETWERTAEGVKSPSFPSGISGEAFVTKKSLYAEGGKSEDLGRSHGFFVRVRNRLINETDPLFGARPLSFSTWYRFAAIVEADDLNRYVTAARDDVEQSSMKRLLRQLLIEVFNQARERFEVATAEEDAKARGKKEGTLDYVSVQLVERPLADAIAVSAENTDTPDVDAESALESWRYLDDVGDLDGVRTLLTDLYDEKRKDRKYKFKYSPLGPTGPFVRLNAVEGEFTINEDHELVHEYSEQPQARKLLETFAAAEALFEVYLRGAGLDASTISHLIDRRDLLLRSLAKDESSALPALARSLRDSVASAVDLEVDMVGAMRALGFAASHISGAGAPDGQARYVAHGSPSVSLTLEAKSSADVPELSQLDFAGLRSHYERIGASGCLLAAPDYPGISDATSEVSVRAEQQKVSCWTVEQLARVVEAAEARHINAKQIEEIVLTAFKPLDVRTAVERLLTSPVYSETEVYRATIQALRDLQPRLKKTPRNVSMLATEISRIVGMESIEEDDVERAVDALARASRGMLHLGADGDIQILGDLDEVERRVSPLTQSDVTPRRMGSFKAHD